MYIYINLSENKVIGYINRKKHAYNSHSNIGKDIWNDLTPKLKSIKFYNTFKKEFKKYYLVSHHKPS